MVTSNRPRLWSQPRWLNAILHIIVSSRSLLTWQTPFPARPMIKDCPLEWWITGKQKLNSRQGCAINNPNDEKPRQVCYRCAWQIKAVERVLRQRELDERSRESSWHWMWRVVGVLLQSTPVLFVCLHPSFFFLFSSASVMSLAPVSLSRAQEKPSLSG